MSALDSVPVPRMLAVRFLPLLVVLFALPHLFTSSFERLVLTTLCLNVIAVVGFDVLYGYTGLLSLGQAAFWGMGAYISALLMLDHGFPFLASFAVAVVLVLAFGVLVGVVATKFEGVFFIIFTLVFGLMVQILLNNLEPITRGTGGVPGVPSPELTIPALGRITVSSNLDYFYLAGVFVFLALIVKWSITRSKLGDILLAVKADPLLAKSLGMPVRKFKIFAFAVAAGFSAVSGVLYAHLFNYIGPADVSMFYSMDIFVMNLLGGAGTFAGQFVGPTIVVVIEEVLRPVDPNLSEMVFGTLLIVLVVFLPNGLVGWFNDLRSGGGGDS